MKKVLYIAGICSTITAMYSCTPKFSKAAAPAGTATEKPYNVFAGKFTTTELEAGKLLMEEKCARCHQLKAVKDYQVEKWATILDRMLPKAKLSGNEGDKVRAYIYAAALAK